jgi:hypothetical protein
MSKLKLSVGVILLVLVGALIGSLGTGLFIKQRSERFALGGPGPPEGAGFIIKRLAPRLDLTDDQRIEIEQLFDDYNEKILDVRSQYLPEIKKINDQIFSSLREKLNEEQIEKMEHLQSRIDRMHKRVPFRRRSHGKGPAHFREQPSAKELLDSMGEQLDLTPEQAELISPIIAESIEKKRNLFEGHRGMDRSERPMMREEMDRIDAQTEEDLAQILSEDQLEAYRGLPGREGFDKHGIGREGFGRRSRRGPPGFMDSPMPAAADAKHIIVQALKFAELV